MAVTYATKDGWVISHKEYLKSVYNAVLCEQEVKNFQFRNSLFKIHTPFMMKLQAKKMFEKYSKCQDNSVQEEFKLGRKRKLSSCDLSSDCCIEVNLVLKNFSNLMTEARAHGLFTTYPEAQIHKENNTEAKEEAERLSTSSPSIPSFHGGNSSNSALVVTVNNHEYIVPPRCLFYSYDVQEMEHYLVAEGKKFDLIILDPPWWNKYIRRKNAKCEKQGYRMMYDKDLANIPISSLMEPNCLVAVWCTNSESHTKCLVNEVFPAWNVDYTSTWYWMKVTQYGEPVCSFSVPPRKQPFEKIIFASNKHKCDTLHSPEDAKLLVSVPSAIHSHKPPLSDMLQPYLPSKPKCLEIFARYLLPDWTSWGNEVLKLQHKSLFEEVITRS